MSGHSSDAWLEGVYHAKTQKDLISLYDGWAATYDADMQGIGYIHPAVMAGLVGRYVQNKSDAIFDAGVGTGTVGNILAITGYTNLIGVDMSEGMLVRAKARKIYSDLRNRVLGDPLDFEGGSMAAIVSTGVFTTGHGPAKAWDELTRITRAGGHLIFTVGTVVWQEAGFADKFDELCKKGLIAPVEVSPVYHPMPYSPTESGFTTRAYVYRRL
ncbi:MAG: class I SAM-dependent methyltransferase [Aestuariivirga sp.]